jgi:hypothetical protein
MLGMLLTEKLANIAQLWWLGRLMTLWEIRCCVGDKVWYYTVGASSVGIVNQFCQEMMSQEICVVLAN